MTAATGLSDRQRQILSYISHGYTSKEIAAKVGLGVEGVKTNIRVIFAALGAVDRAHAVRLGFEEGVLKASATRRPRKPVTR